MPYPDVLVVVPVVVLEELVVVVSVLVVCVLEVVGVDVVPVLPDTAPPDPELEEDEVPLLVPDEDEVVEPEDAPPLVGVVLVAEVVDVRGGLVIRPLPTSSA